MADYLTMHNAVMLLFVITYILIVKFYHKKTYIIWSAILLLLIVGVITPFEALKAINWNVIGIYVGMLFIAEMFIYSKLPDFLAEKIVNKSSKVWIAMLGVCFLSGLLSIVVENVAVVLIIAPIALLIARKLKINPIPLVIGIAISSNLQGVATMIGDPPSLLLANYAKLNFNDFFFFQGKPGLFFAVQLAAVVSLVVLYLIYKKYNLPVENIHWARVRSKLPGYALIGMIVVLAISSWIIYTGNSGFFMIIDNYKAGLICILYGLFVWFWYYKMEKDDFIPLVKRLDWDTGFFLVGIFILVESLIKIGFMTTFATYIASLTGNNVFFAYVLIVWGSVIFSGFIDNVPFIAAMFPVVGNLAQFMGVNPYLFYFGLVLGASVGGNITPVGAAANIVAMGILKKNGSKPKFWDFIKIGLPFTIVSVFVSSVFIWFMFR